MTTKARNYLLTGAIFFLLCAGRAGAQEPVTDSAVRAAAIANTIERYHRFMPAPPALYNGPEYKEYFRTLQEGNPFFREEVDFAAGTIMYDNILYKDLSLKFDLVKKMVVARDPSGIFGISLFHDKIRYFTVHGHTVIRLVKEEDNKVPATGFYDVLFNGHAATLLKKENKTVQTRVNQLEGVWNYIDYKRDFFVSRNNEYYDADTRGGLLNALKDKKQELQQYIRSNKLKFNKDELEKTLLSVVTYYNTLKK